jgi:ABC-type lipoprotein export system ATPase subunit
MSAENQKACFVCQTPILNSKYTLNKNVMLPVCATCKGTEAEKNKESELLDSLGDGQICGCI